MRKFFYYLAIFCYDEIFAVFSCIIVITAMSSYGLKYVEEGADWVNESFLFQIRAAENSAINRPAFGLVVRRPCRRASSRAGLWDFRFGDSL